LLPENRAPTHPGEILLQEFLKPLNITQVALAAKLKVPVQRVNTLISGKRGVTPDTAILLGMAFETTPQFWMNLQSNFDLWHRARAIQANIIPFRSRRTDLKATGPKGRAAGLKKATRKAAKRKQAPRSSAKSIR
jgi:antitoxin HigA-1